jgi:hypothetical protein
MSHKLFEKVRILSNKRTYPIASTVLVLVFSLHSLFSQATIPTLQLTEYDSNLMSEIYGQTYFMNSVSAWEETVKYYQGLIRAAWESSADQAIYDYVDSITMSDAYNTVAAYKDYVSRELFSQKEEALITWEDRANLDLLSNRNEFVARLNTDRVNEVYLDRLYQGFLVANLANEAPITLQNQIEAARSNWENTYEQSYIQGNYEFTNAFTQINQSYTDVLASLDTTEQAFKDNLLAIDKYKKEVKGAIAGMLTGFETDLAKSCNPALGCAYRKADQSYNDSGELLSSLITRIRARLDAPVVEATFALTDLAVEMNQFLKTQRDVAQANFDRDNNLVFTYQTTLNGASIDKPVTSTDLGALRDTVRNGTYTSWYLSSGDNQWHPSTDFNNNPFQNVGPETIDNAVTSVKERLLRAMHEGKNNDIIAILNEQQASGRSIRAEDAGALYYNIYTQDSGFRNKFDPFYWTGVGKSGFCGVLDGACNSNLTSIKQGNMILDREANRDYKFYQIYRGPVVDNYQMDSVNFGLVYKVFDQNKQDQANYWSGIRSSMNGQVNQYEINITPAIRSWETQVNNYNQFYTDWKIKADITRAQALVDRDNAISQLEENKQRWIGKIQDEFIAGRNQWDGMERQATLTSSNAEAKALDLQVQSKLASLGQTDFGTGTSTILANFSQSLDTLTSTTVNNISLFGAETKMSVATSLQIGNKDISQVLQTTVNGVYQYAQLLSVNENNNNAAIAEQKKLINQMTYGIKWEDRAVAKFGEDGSLIDKSGNVVRDDNLRNILKELTNSKKYEAAIRDCTSKLATGAVNNCFDTVHASRIADLKRLGYEYQDGMIVESLTEDQKFRLGIREPGAMSKNVAELTPEQREREKDFGSCYVDPTKCSDLLRKDFIAEFDEKTKIVKLTREISNGRVMGRDSNGKYIDGKQVESRSVMLASVKPVSAPKGKDLFDVWGNEDWKDFESQANDVMTSFYNVGLTKDSNNISRQVADIRSVESTNERKFQKEKQAREAHDSLVKDLLIAYISGGMAGVKGAIKNKVEDQINTSLAEAWARATGADDDQIAMLSDAISFMRGKVQEKKIRDRANTFSMSNPIRSIENAYAKSSSALNRVTGGVSGTVMGFVATGVTTVVKTVAKAATAVTGAIGTGVAAILDPMGTVVGEMAKATSEYLDKQLPRMTGAKDAISGIRANEKGIVQKYATNALAVSTGLPPEVASNIIGDYVGSQAAKKARRAVVANPLMNVTTQVVGVVGGIVKTAAVAFGAKDRDIQKAFSQGNRIANAGSVDVTSAEIQSEAFMNQTFGLKSSATSYTSSTPTLKDEKGFVKELFQREAVKQLSVGMSENDRAILNSAFRANVSKREQSKADKKAQKDAARSTAITAITTIVTLGAATAVTGPLAAVQNAIQGGLRAIGTFLKVGAKVAVQAGAAAVKTAVQVADGSRNGTDGMLAGLANGVLGYFGSSGAFDLNKIAGLSGTFLSNSALGLGVSYDRQAGWGGMIGVGSGSANANISFSQRGNTTVSASAAPIEGLESVQFTGTTTTNGATTVGVNINAGKGPREGWNVGANYDIHGGTVSGSVGYTDPNTGFGLTSTIDGNGLSTSGQLNGVNLVTNGPDGFVMEEMNWSEQNINLAQDRTNDLRDDATLKAAGFSDEQIANMKPQDRADLLAIATADQVLRDEGGYSQDAIKKMTADQRQKLAADLTRPAFDPEAIAVGAAASVGTFFAGAFAFAGGTTGTGQTPTNTRADGPVVGRRREDGEVGSAKDRINAEAKSKLENLKGKLDQAKTASEKKEIQSKIRKIEADRTKAIKEVQILHLDKPVSVAGKLPDFKTGDYASYSFKAKLEEIDLIGGRLRSEIDAQINEAKSIDPNDKRMQERIRSLEKEKLKLISELNNAKFAALTQVPNVTNILGEISNRGDFDTYKATASELKQKLIDLKSETKDFNQKDKSILERNKEIDTQLKKLDLEVMRSENQAKIKEMRLETTFERLPVTGLSETELKQQQTEYRRAKKEIDSKFSEMIEAAKKTSDKEYIKQLNIEYAKATEIMSQRGTEIANQLAELHIAPLRKLLTEGGNPQEFSNTVNNLSENDRKLLFQESIKLGNAVAFIPVANVAPIQINIVDTPAHIKFSDTPEMKKVIGKLEDTIRDSIEINQARYENDLSHAMDPVVQKNYDKYVSDLAAQDTLVKNANDRLTQLNLQNHPGALFSTDPAVLKQYDAIQKELKTISNEKVRLEKVENDLKIKNQKLIDKKVSIDIARDLVKNKDFEATLDPKLKEAVNEYNQAKANYENMVYLTNLNLDDAKPNQAALDKFKAEIDKAESKLEKFQDSLNEIQKKLSQKGDFSEMADNVKTLFKKDSVVLTIPEKTKVIEVPVYQNPTTGEFRIGSGVDARSFAEGSGPGTPFFQDASNPQAIEMANKLRKELNIGSNVTNAEIINKWCQAASLWATCRNEFGAAVDADFVDFVKKHKDSFKIEPGNVMYVKANDTIMNTYADKVGKEWYRDKFKDTNPNITRDQAYTKIAEAMQTTTSNSVMIRISSSHTISIHRDGPGGEWIVKDTGHSDINGTTVDPYRIKDSVIYKENTYTDKLPESIAFPVVSRK